MTAVIKLIRVWKGPTYEVGQRGVFAIIEHSDNYQVVFDDGRSAKTIWKSRVWETIGGGNG